MKIRLHCYDVVNVLPCNVSYDQLALVLKNLCKTYDIHFCQRQVGCGVLQWILPEGAWMPLSAASGPLQTSVRQYYEECCQQIVSANKANASLVEAALSVPSDDYIFFCQQGGGLFAIALTAWGYRFPRPGGGNPPRGKGQPIIDRQEVRLCFVYDGQRLLNHSFKINNLQRRTSEKGIFEAGTHGVGTVFPIEMDDGTTFTLTVEKGKDLYEFDLTKYFFIQVNVNKGWKPLQGTSCAIAYNGRKIAIITDGNGQAEARLPFALTPTDCIATVEGVKQSKQAVMPRTIMNFNLPYEKQFRNVDCKTGEPIAGVKNVVTITSPDGTQNVVTVVSDDNGMFTILAMEDSRLALASTKSPEYEPKHTEEPQFGNANEEIPMLPNTKTLHFRTIDAITGLLLPKCDLRMTGSKSGLLKPDKSGDGTFDVRLRLEEQLTIVASKKGYITNTDKVNSRTYEYLQASPDRRDIPLMPNKPLKYEYKGDRLNVTKTYDMYYPNREFKFEWDVCSGCTTVTLTDGDGNVLGRYGYGIGPGSGSVLLRCPTKDLKVIVRDENRHDAHYIITSKY